MAGSDIRLYLVHNAYVNKYSGLKYKYKYEYSSLKYEYKYKYFKIVLEYNSSTGTSTKYYKSATAFCDGCISRPLARQYWLFDELLDVRERGLYGAVDIMYGNADEADAPPEFVAQTRSPMTASYAEVREVPMKCRAE